ncbi:flagellar biosynthesis repressor FlbT [Methylobacterium sp. CB376]|uniref:flagellar biosynthesis repressor FlbT n=1 Tax=unclassified Methylobacterium TaxID=2615210 RepID=UPI00030683FD|nr:MULTISPECIES: flagellar biosynthesis repressor FlbT [Methylobacterium]WFT79920.1 flagellar biosynthesis repressor FlbT [Methylobacterium nodulans]
MRLSLRAGERVYVNGAVLRVDRRVSLELLNEATFLLEQHVLQPEQATTPLRQLYFAAQVLLMDPAGAEPARKLYDELHAGLMAALTNAEIREGLMAASAQIAAGRPYEALKLIRNLYAAEAAVLDGGAAQAELPPPRRVVRSAGRAA